MPSRGSSIPEGRTDGVHVPAGVGPPVDGELDVTLAVEAQRRPDKKYPADSACALTEPLAAMPALADAAWSWGEPTFTVDGRRPPGTVAGSRSYPKAAGRTPQPNVAIAVINNVIKDGRRLHLSRSRAIHRAGTLVQPGRWSRTRSRRLDRGRTGPRHRRPRRAGRRAVERNDRRRLDRRPGLDDGGGRLEPARVDGRRRRRRGNAHADLPGAHQRRRRWRHDPQQRQRHR